MYIYLYSYTSIYLYTYLSIYIYIYIHTHTHTHQYIWIHIYIYLYTYISLSLYIYIYMCVCVNAQACTCTLINYLCKYIYVSMISLRNISNQAFISVNHDQVQVFSYINSLLFTDSWDWTCNHQMTSFKSTYISWTICPVELMRFQVQSWLQINKKE